MLRLALALVILILLGSAVFIRKDYQDTWVLEGLEVPFALFVLTYVMAFFSEKRVSWMIALAVIGRIVFLLVPNLKYVWFQGPWMDQQVQYALANHVVNQGHIVHGVEVFGGKIYADTPVIHLAFSTFSMILNIPVMEAIKYLPVLLSSLYPLLTYVVINRTKLPLGIWKYALFVSSMPLDPGQYLVSGQMFGALLVFLILSCLAILFHKNDRRFLSMLIILTIVLAATHSSSSVLLTTSFLIVMLLQKFHRFRIDLGVRSSLIFTIAIVCVTWLTFPASFTFDAILAVFAVRVPAGITPRSGAIPERFFELARVDVFSAIRTLLIEYGASIWLLLMTLVGLLALLRYRKQANKVTAFLSIYVMSVFAFMVVGLLLKVGAFRPLFLMSLVFPIFSAIFILHTSGEKKWISRVALGVMLFLTIFQLYSYQPLVPSANVLFSDLPAAEPLFHVTNVNSIYQRHMIFFARDNIINGRIACDRITRSQILGFAGFEFWVSHVIEYYPIDKNQPRRAYDFFLIHLPGVSGRFQEPVETRTKGLILGTIYNTSVIYTNGESYVLTDSQIT